MQQLPIAINADKPEVCALEVLDGVIPAVWFIRRLMKSYRKGLTLQQFRALVFIDKRPSVCLSTLRDHLGASLPTVSRVISGLVARELVKREGCRDDRRQMSLAITLKGQEVLRGAWVGTQGRLAEELAHLEPAQRETLAEAMKLLKLTFGSLSLSDKADAATGAEPSEAEQRRQRRSVSASP